MATALARFFACYLLVSLSEEAGRKGRTYIGFTTNPPRRLRQHNGELVNGAKRTKSLRPCAMVLVVHGFASQVQALQFEWAWQHPTASKAVRGMAASLGPARVRSGAQGKVRVLFGMLALPQWSRCPLAVHFLGTEHDALRRGLAPPPAHVSISVGTFADLPLKSGPATSGDEADDLPDDDDDDDAGEGSATASGVTGTSAAIGGRGGTAAVTSATRCCVCHARVGPRRTGCMSCGARSHAACLAAAYLTAEGAPPEMLLPTGGSCPACGAHQPWAAAVAAGRGGGRAPGAAAAGGRPPLRALPPQSGGAAEGDAGVAAKPKRAPRKAKPVAAPAAAAAVPALSQSPSPPTMAARAPPQPAVMSHMAPPPRDSSPASDANTGGGGETSDSAGSAVVDLTTAPSTKRRGRPRGASPGYGAHTPSSSSPEDLRTRCAAKARAASAAVQGGDVICLD